MEEEILDEAVEELEESNQEEKAPTDSKKKTKKKEPKKTDIPKVELDFEMDPSERLKIEVANAPTSMEKVIGEHLLIKFEKEEKLKNSYKERKVKLSDIVEFVNNKAKEYLQNKSGAIEDTVIFGWCVHYVLDEEIEIPESKSYYISKEDEETARLRALKRLEEEQYQKLKNVEEQKLQKAQKAKEKLEEKEKKIQEETGQLSLFD